jgi:DNA replication protein DnaC
MTHEVPDALTRTIRRIRRYVKKPELYLWSLEAFAASTGLPPRHFNTDPKDYHPKWAKTRDTIIEKLGSGFLILVIGNRNTGKTQLAVETAFAAHGQQRSVRFATAWDMFDRLKQSFTTGETRYKSTLNTTRYLIIDEIDKRIRSDWENGALFELINLRYNRELDTLLLGNLQPDQLNEHLGPSIIRRINETGTTFLVDWPPYTT